MSPLSFQVQRLGRIPTLRFMVSALALAVLAILLDELKRPLWAQARTLAHLMDYAAVVLGWTGVAALCVGVVVGPFRPKDQFSMHGLCRSRLVNFLFALGALALVFLYQAMRIAGSLSR